MSFKRKIFQWLERRQHHRLERLISKKRTYAILIMLSDRRESVRLDAVHALGFCRDDLAYQALTELLKDSLASIRKAAALSLAHMNHPGSAASIERQMRVEKDLPVIDIMRTALLQIQKTA